MAFKKVQESASLSVEPVLLSGHLINTDRDNLIDVANLQDEFRVYPSVLYSHCEAKSSGQDIYDRCKGRLVELEAEVYIEIKSRPEKSTEAGVQAMIDTDPRVKKARGELLSAGRDLETLKNYVESMRAKKDMIIQLGADSRKESY